jgi:hypothetical protein
MNRVKDYQDRELKAYLMLMDLIPAQERDDMKKIGDIVWKIDFRGSKRAEVELHGFEIYWQMSLLRERGEILWNHFGFCQSCHYRKRYPASKQRTNFSSRCGFE